MGTHRLFVAVDPPALVAAEVAGWARAARGQDGALRVIPPDRIHLTLSFCERPKRYPRPPAGFRALGSSSR